MIYATMFIVAFLSGSLLPLGSEALFIYYISSGHSIVLLLIVASFGNILGSVLNYYLGFKGESYLLSKGYIKNSALTRAKRAFAKWGGLSLLLSSVPIIGDPLTFIAGILHYSFNKFIIFVAISKSLRYIFLALLI